MAQPESQQVASKQQELQMFKNLRERGLTAAPNFSCCNACGVWEVDRIRRPTDFGESVQIAFDPSHYFCYVFYDWQSALKIQNTGNVMLGFGSYPEIGSHSAEQVARIVVEEAQRKALVGIQAEWSGSTNERIKLRNLRKEDYTEAFEVLAEYPNEPANQRTAVIRTRDGRTFPFGFGDVEVNHTCGSHGPNCMCEIPPEGLANHPMFQPQPSNT